MRIHTGAQPLNFRQASSVAVQGSGQSGCNEIDREVPRKAFAIREH